MSKFRKPKRDFEDDDEGYQSIKEIKKDMDRRKEKYMKNALRSKDISAIMNEEDFD